MSAFTGSADWYDLIYAVRGKDYAAEAAWVDAQLPSTPERRTWLDVGCGTGEHLRHWCQRHDVAGVDQNASMLQVARAKLPDVPFVEADMRSLALGRTFDVVTSMFASVAYLPNAGAVSDAVQAMAHHVAPGGSLCIEPGVFPESVQPPVDQVTRFEGDGVVLERRTSTSI
ncbi:MAG: class I SAM-dependent methyltransferase, partial [Planctomycetota bacterium]